MSTSVTLKNMFGINSNINISIPDESRNIINQIIYTYDSIYKYFDVETDVNSLKNALDNYIDNQSNNTSFNNAGSLYELYRNINDNIIKNVLNGRDSEDSLELVESFVFNLIYFSLFKFNAEQDERRPDGNDGQDVGDENLIFEYFNEGDKDGYRFLPNNKFFKFMDIFIGESWRDQTSYYRKSIVSKKEVNTISILTDGYFRDGDKIIPIFPEILDIKKFIYDCIINTTMADVYTESNFIINILNSMTFGLSEKIKNTLEEKITEQEAESQENTDKGYSFCDNINIKIKSASELLETYFDIFKESIELLKNYAETIKNEYSSTQKLMQDEYIVKLVNKIVGAQKSSSGVIFSQNNNLQRYDSSPNNSSLDFISFILRKLINTGDNPQIWVFGGSSQNIKNINKKETILPNYVIKAKEDDNQKVLFENLASKMSLEENSDYDQSLYFYETTLYKKGELFGGITKAEGEEDKSFYKRKIDKFCEIGGCIISKFILLSLYDLNKTSEYKYNNPQTLQCSSFKLVKKYTYANKIIYFDNQYYYEYSKAYNAFGSAIIKYINSIIKVVGKSGENANKNAAVQANKSNFENYIKSRIGNQYFTEKDYFYIKDGNGISRIPSNSFVDIEFRVPKYDENDNISIVWIPVTSMRTENTGEDNKIVLNEDKGYREMHAGTYFDSFELTDNGGIKEINLTLKSVNDINLERIIFNSLSLDSKLVNAVNGTTNVPSYIDEMLKNTESNFRIRFGYRDVAAKDASNNNTAVTTSNNSDNDFINRTKTFELENKRYVKPVLVYPWTYFKITGLDSNIKNGEDTYTIKGTSSGSYILSHMSLCGITTNFSKDSSDDDFRGTPRNVVGKLAKWITLASTENSESQERDITTARICFLGDIPGSIITDFDNKTGKFRRLKYRLKGDEVLNGGNIQTIEEKFYNTSNNQVLGSKNFNILNDTKSLSLKEILDGLMSWLPNRVYYIAKLENSNQTAALYVPYDTIYTMDDFFTNYPFKTESMVYQIIEADAHIYDPTASTEDNSLNIDSEDYYHKTYFIRMYYKGPGISTTEDGDIPNEYLRIYNYRSLQEQVIEEMEISSTNDSEFGNTVSSVMLLGSGTPTVFAYNKEKGTVSKTMTSCTSGDPIDSDDVKGIKDLGRFSEYFSPKSNVNINPKLVFNNSEYILSNVKGSENFDAISSMYTEEATNFFTDQQNKQYEGELTILGDPFYYFDSSLEAGKYEIYLQMNRVKNMMSYERTDSKYSGIYFITGIRHNMDQSGKYTTTLSITKRIFGSDDGVNVDDGDKNKTTTEN